MADKQRLLTTICLRRDTLINFANHASHVPEKGEVCLVDTLSRGTRIKIGDGTNTFASLPWYDQDCPSVILGYYFNAKFYKDVNHTIEIPIGNEPADMQTSKFNSNTIYIDIPSNIIYYWNGIELKESTVTIPTADAEKPGIMKLYTGHGYNADGTMTQQAITEAIDDIIFAVDKDDEETLILNKPW